MWYMCVYFTIKSSVDTVGGEGGRVVQGDVVLPPHSLVVVASAVAGLQRLDGQTWLLHPLQGHLEHKRGVGRDQPAADLCGAGGG